MNQIEGKWKGVGGGTQLFILIVFSYFGAILGISIMKLLFGNEIYATAYNIRVSNAIGTIFYFLLPVLVYSYLFADLKGEFLRSRPVKWILVLLGALAICCIQPFTSLIQHYNGLIELPESMASFQEALKQGEEVSRNSMMLLFADKTMSSFLVNLVVLAVLPAVLEELFFRGCMQRSLTKLSRNIHVVIWITAVIFSLFHMQISGFFPRILLGVLLGYLYAWSGNIWIPIVAHFLNNAMVVVMEQFLSETDFYRVINSGETSILAAIISLAVTVTILLFVYKSHQKTNSLNESPLH